MARRPSGTEIRIPPLRESPISQVTVKSDPRLRYRAAYDWTVFPPEVLPRMEAYWDRVVDLFQSLLPQRLLEDPTARKGLNLGTYNGSYQKAWQRSGFDMYGIEYVEDAIAELHEYGCRGEHASYFSMPRIQDDRFDFAVLDRAMLNKPYLIFFGPRSDGNAVLGNPAVKRGVDQPFRIKDPASGSETVVPPYFGEIFRVLKPDGVLLAVLYPYWSDHVLRELASYGEMRFWPVARPRPYLAVVVDRARPPLPYPARDQLFARLSEAEADVATDLLRADPTVWGLRVRGDRARFLHLPDNHLVSWDLSARRARSDDFWPVSEHRERFFARSYSLSSTPQSEDRSVVWLTDRVLRKKGLLKRMKGVEPLIVDPPPRSFAESEAFLDALREAAPQGTTVLASLFHYDSSYVARKGEIRKTPEAFSHGLEDFLCNVGEAGYRCLLVSPQLSGDLPVEQIEAARGFSERAATLCSEAAVPYLSLPSISEAPRSARKLARSLVDFVTQHRESPA